jgi:predicted metalloprotease with PDZ domain
MRRTTAVIAGLVLVAGLAGCGQDSSGNANEEFCTELATLQADVDEFNSMVGSSASFNDLEVQAQAVAADAKNLSATTQRLEDQEAKDAMNAATVQLETALGAVDVATSSEAESVAAVKAAMKEYEASVDEVAAQVGCTTG